MSAVNDYLVPVGRAARYALSFLAVSVLCGLPAAHAANPRPTAWLLGYEGKSSNDVAGDRRLAGLVQTRIPAQWSAKLMRGLAGPPDPVWIVADRFVSLAACVPHDCGEKGFLWLDTATGIGLSAYADGEALTLASNGLASAGIPAQARRALADWIAEHDLHPVSVQFVGQDGPGTVLDPASFQPPEQFQPPENGPSFDCRRALTRVEGAICNNAALSRADLALATLVERVRHGTSTSSARKQLTELQRAWEKSRDANCTAAANTDACINDAYQQQQDRVWNWIPTK